VSGWDTDRQISALPVTASRSLGHLVFKKIHIVIHYASREIGTSPENQSDSRDAQNGVFGSGHYLGPAWKAPCLAQFGSMPSQPSEPIRQPPTPAPSLSIDARESLMELPMDPKRGRLPFKQLPWKSIHFAEDMILGI
jgi:hypothetical protein